MPAPSSEHFQERNSHRHTTPERKRHLSLPWAIVIAAVILTGGALSIYFLSADSSEEACNEFRAAVDDLVTTILPGNGVLSPLEAEANRDQMRDAYFAEGEFEWEGEIYEKPEGCTRTD